MAGNLLGGDYRQTHVDQAAHSWNPGRRSSTVREPGAFAKAISRALSISPLTQMRARLDEIPTDRPVYLNCRSSQTSYNAVRLLQGHGFTNVGQPGRQHARISLYEYFTDVTTGREPIVTAYCFD